MTSPAAAETTPTPEERPKSAHTIIVEAEARARVKLKHAQSPNFAIPEVPDFFILFRQELESGIAAALRSYGDRRAREMRERIAAIVRDGIGCTYVDHVQDLCECRDKADEILDLPLTPPAPDGGTDTQDAGVEHDA